MRDPAEADRAHRVLQGAVPDVAYIDPGPGDGEEKIVEPKPEFINMWAPLRLEVRSRSGRH